jgi:glycerol-3-phosphate dehydrogenase
MMPSPERICIDLLRDAQMDNEHAYAFNYMRVGQAKGDTVELHDEVSGETIVVKPKIVVNAAGPWIDFANETMGQTTRLIGGTKGSHLVLDHPELRDAINGREFFFENADGRIVLIYPFLDRVMVGTSDILIESPDEARCTEAEVDYFLGMIKRVFPAIQVDRWHIVFRFSGVRPLPASDSPSYTGQISRDHSIEVIEPGKVGNFPVYCLVGGKWTTFRAFAEKTADKVLQFLGQRRQFSTADLAIGGGKAYPRSEAERSQWLQIWQHKSGLSRARLSILFERYGTQAAAVAQFIAEGEDQPLFSLPTFSQRELIYLAANEQVVHLDDIILRRSLMGMQGLVTADLMQELAQTVAPALDWTDEQKTAEIIRTHHILSEQHGVILE